MPKRLKIPISDLKLDNIEQSLDWCRRMYTIGNSVQVLTNGTVEGTCIVADEEDLPLFKEQYKKYMYDLSNGDPHIMSLEKKFDDMKVIVDQLFKAIGNKQVEEIKPQPTVQPEVLQEIPPSAISAPVAAASPLVSELTVQSNTQENKPIFGSLIPIKATQTDLDKVAKETTSKVTSFFCENCGEEKRIPIPDHVDINKITCPDCRNPIYIKETKKVSKRTMIIVGASVLALTFFGVLMKVLVFK